MRTQNLLSISYRFPLDKIGIRALVETGGPPFFTSGLIWMPSNSGLYLRKREVLVVNRWKEEERGQSITWCSFLEFLQTHRPLNMETTNASIVDAGNAGLEKVEATAAEEDNVKHSVDELFVKVDNLEQRVNEVEQFYLDSTKKQLNPSKGSSIVKEKDKEKHVPSIKKQQLDASRREAAAAKRMHELMRQFGTIIRQAITNFCKFLCLCGSLSWGAAA
ncbi:unnamed protein product [Ilex paraguariensis]|uniref:Uncharacterized protein n=1 Tax=Ilex paraguariensis TaxID=185542 RepID=A0ABC8QTU6_9AQUA